MRRSLALCALAAAWMAAPARAQVDDGVAAALALIDPALRLADGAATVQSGDFDGDGRSDVAALVTDDRHRGLAAFHAGPRGYRAHVLNNRLPDGAVRLRIVPPGRHRVIGGRGYVELTMDAIELVFPGRSSVFYVWDGERYRVHATESYAEGG